MAEPQPRDDSLNPNTWGAFQATDETGRVTSGELPPASDKPAPAPDGAPSSSPDLDRLTGADSTVFQGLAGIQATKMGEEDKLNRGIDTAVGHDRDRVQRAYEQEGVGPDELKPWNVEQQRAKYMTKPLDAFGSFGSVFAILASSFTHAPMKNALNGAAAAMNAIKAGDEKEYTAAYDAWKDNVKLAQERHRIQHESYEAAIQLMTTDMTLGRSKLQMLAARFGDKKALFLMENGYDKEFFDAMRSRDQAMKSAVEAADALQLHDLQTDVLKKEPRWNSASGNPAFDAISKLEAFQRTHGVKQTPQQEILGKWIYQHAQDNGGKGPTAEETRDFWRTLAPASRGATRFSGFIDQFVNQAGQAYDQASPEEQAAAQDGTQAVPKSIEQSFEEQFRRTYPEAGDDDIATAKGELATKLKGQFSIPKQQAIAAQELMSNDPAVRAHGEQRMQAIQRAKQETALPKSIPTIDKKTLSSTPSLMDALQDLYAFADATGPLKGPPESLVAKYGGINDPAAVWAAAKAKADAALIEAQAGRMSVTGLKHLLETMPKNYQDARYNRLQIQSAMHQVADEAQTFLSAMEASGEKIPPSVMDKFTSLGIFPESQKARDPVYKLRTNPQSIPDGELMDLRKRNLSLSPQDMGLLKQELERRRKAWDEQTRTIINPGGDKAESISAKVAPQVPTPRPRPEQAAPGFLDQPDPNEPFDDTETDDEWVRRQDRDENTRMAPIEMDPKQGLTRDRNVFDEFTTPLQGQAPPGASIPPGRMSPQWQVSGRPDLAQMFPAQYEREPGSLPLEQNHPDSDFLYKDAPGQDKPGGGEGGLSRQDRQSLQHAPRGAGDVDPNLLMFKLFKGHTDQNVEDFEQFFGPGSVKEFMEAIDKQSSTGAKPTDEDLQTIIKLRNPNTMMGKKQLQKMKTDFDKKFGPGAADKFMQTFDDFTAKQEMLY